MGGNNNDDGDLILEVDGIGLGKIALRSINKVRRKAGLPILES